MILSGISKRVASASKDAGTQVAKEITTSAARPAALALDTLADGLHARAKAAAQASRERLVGKFPTLDDLVRDPDAFVADIRARFAAQQRLTPAHPYRFDFSDYGLPVLKQWQTMLREEAAEVQGRKLAHLGKHPMGSVQEHDTALALLGKLSREIDGHLGRGRISYERLQELSDYVSRGMGRFDKADLRPMHRIMLPIDEAVQGTTATTAAQDLRRYQKNLHAGAFFDGESMLPAYGKEPSARFIAERFDPRKLNFVALPTSESINYEIFERTSTRGIYLEGITRKPLLADGFNRPTKLFREHDLRHNQAIHGGWLEYRQKNRVTPEQSKMLIEQVDVWREELLAWKKTIKDPQLKNAVEFVDFNLYHDRGIPAVPSSFTPKKMTDEYIVHLLFAAQKLGNQGTGFNDIRSIRKAYGMLREFWLARAPQEEAILKVAK